MNKLLIFTMLLIALLAISGCSKEEIVQNEDNTAPEQDNEDAAIVNETPAEEEIVEIVSSFQPPIPNVATAVIDGATNAVTIEFKNTLNTSIKLPLTGTWAKYSETKCIDFEVVAFYKNERVEALVTEIKPGDKFTVRWDCEDPKNMPSGTAYSADLAFNYKNTATGMVKPRTGTVTGTYK